MKTNIQKIEFDELELIINNKIYDFTEKYNKYPKYLKLPLWISECMKREMIKIQSYNLDYNTGLLQYRNLIVCETIAISQPKEIEVF